MHTCLYIRLKVDGRGVGYIASPKDKTFSESIARCGGFGADDEEKLSYFGLKNDNKSNKPNAYDLTENSAGKAHVEVVSQLLCHDNNHNCPENAHYVSATNQTIEIEEERSDKENIDNVDKANGVKAWNEQ